MTVKFSKHALQRNRERFAHAVHDVVDVMEQGIRGGWAKRTRGTRFEMIGSIDGRPMKVVYVQNGAEDFVVITATWVSASIVKC